LQARTAVALAVLSLSARTAGAAQVWTAQATEKIRPSAAARASPAIHVSAARNEFEAFQVVVTGAAANVRATATPLAGPGAALPIRLYREALISLSNASALDGATGAWPDALVPAVDELAGEARNAFPFSVASGESRAVWAEVHVPAGAAPGDYAGSVQLSWDGGSATVPVKLTVWPFTLPSTASLKSAFALSYGALVAGHGVSGGALSTLRARYGQLALDHRVSLSRIDDGQPDLAHFTAAFGPELDGTTPAALGGARLTAVQYQAGGSADLGGWASWFAARGWSDRLFQYTCDEPPITCAWSDIPARASAARAAKPALRTLVTTTIGEAEAHGVADAIDILVPVVNSIDDKPNSGNPESPRSAYDAFLASSSRRELWLYQSCMSHGCGGTVNAGNPSASDQYYTGWPSYMIDASGPRNRAMQWLDYKYGASGELYYETGMAFSHDAWSNQWDFGGNGDGTLFYPGTPATIGGTSDVPVASIRLKLIREGMEDYEYLKLLEAQGDGAFAHEVVDALFPHAYATDVTPEALLAAREKLALRIVANAGGGAPAGAGGTSPGGVSAIEAWAAQRSSCASGAGGELLAFAGLGALVVLRLRGRRRSSSRRP
jgi:hypothetical protein